MTIPTITINEDVKCKQCSKLGACKVRDGEYGLCMDCVAKNLERMNMKNTNELVRAEVDNLINDEWHRIVPAYRNSCYELGISVKINIAGSAEVVNIETELSYYPLPKMKVKTDKVTADEKQIKLPMSELG